MVVEDQAIARTRPGGALLVSMDLSVLEGKGKLKDAKGKGTEFKGTRKGKKRQAMEQDDPANKNQEKTCSKVDHEAHAPVLTPPERRVVQSRGDTAEKWRSEKLRC